MKPLINHQRSEKKMTMDMDTVRTIAEQLLKRHAERVRLKAVSAGLPAGWEKKILAAAVKETPERHRFLTEDPMVKVLFAGKIAFYALQSAIVGNM